MPATTDDPPARARRDPSLARQMLLLQVAVVLVLVVAAGLLAVYDARSDSRSLATQRALAVASSVADSPTVAASLGSADPSATLQPFAEQVRRDTGVDFVVVMSLDRVRYTHPDPDRIGERFVGDVGTAPEGRPFVQEYEGTLGPSMRAVVPVRAEPDGPVVAMVSAGITLSQIGRDLDGDLLRIGLVALAVLLAGLGSTLLVVRRLRRATHGLGEREITRMFEYYTAVLHAVREGLLLVDHRDRIQLVNDEAVRLLGLPDADSVVGRSVHDVGLAPRLVEAVLGEAVESDELYVAGDRLVVVSTAPAAWQGRTVGSVVTLRDHTELRDVTGELDVVRGLTESLRAQTHESANRLHTVVSLIEMGRADDAVAFATEELRTAQRLTDAMVGAVGDPVLAALLLGKSAEAAERGVELVVEGDLPPDGPVAGRDLVTVVGNLLDNALDAVADNEPARRRVLLSLDGDDHVVRLGVGDSGPGLDPADADRILERGWTTKADDAPGGRGVGLALVGEVARRHGGRIEVGVSPLGGAELEVTLHRPGTTAGSTDAGSTDGGTTDDRARMPGSAR